MLFLVHLYLLEVGLYDDLCRALIYSVIPLYKFENSALKDFLEKYTDHKIPDESTLRKNYVSGIYEKTISKI